MASTYLSCLRSGFAPGPAPTHPREIRPNRKLAFPSAAMRMSVEARRR